MALRLLRKRRGRGLWFRDFLATEAEQRQKRDQPGANQGGLAASGWTEEQEKSMVAAETGNSPCAAAASSRNFGLLVRAGAPDEILYVSKPHIGTFRLTGVVSAMREEIKRLGGDVRFESKVEDFIIRDGRMEGVVLNTGEEILSRHVVLALGHSARDTFRKLHERGVYVEAKPFAIGFRIEHPQNLIDKARLGKFAGHPQLGAAD